MGKARPSTAARRLQCPFLDHVQNFVAAQHTAFQRGPLMWLFMYFRTFRVSSSSDPRRGVYGNTLAASSRTSPACSGAPSSPPLIHQYTAARSGDTPPPRLGNFHYFHLHVPGLPGPLGRGEPRSWRRGRCSRPPPLTLAGAGSSTPCETPPGREQHLLRKSGASWFGRGARGAGGGGLRTGVGTGSFGKEGYRQETKAVVWREIRFGVTARSRQRRSIVKCEHFSLGHSPSQIPDNGQAHATLNDHQLGPRAKKT